MMDFVRSSRIFFKLRTFKDGRPSLNVFSLVLHRPQQSYPLTDPPGASSTGVRALPGCIAGQQTLVNEPTLTARQVFHAHLKGLSELANGPGRWFLLPIFNPVNGHPTYLT
jgi:hypothetical protein